ncbi:MAG: GntR family transcriptional regulator, transcriptional repressor for pyruvate dehydrogenase complex [Solirubrobacteraceae bacterium]|jgi:DNA-binding FadR family transcriptional regulator|nr:GntR family transcriptional regulator, transcriptional repressor for pyruvate dehydrogenase complex [Solirubrobacteraceae bacterium]
MAQRRTPTVVPSDVAVAVVRPLRPARRRSLTDEILDQLLELIASGSPPEVRLPSERVLCAELAVSRTALREALSALSHLGVVQTRAKVKYGSPLRARTAILSRSQMSDPSQVSATFEVRRMLEPQVAAAAAERAAPEAIEEMEQLLEALPDGGASAGRIVELDTAFHAAIARATMNPVVMQLVTALNDAAQEERVATYRNPAAVEVARSGHARIVAAIKAGDKAAARRAMERHLKEAERVLYNDALGTGGG